MQPGQLTFFALLFGTEFFVVATFGLIFEQRVFYQLTTFSLVMTLLLGVFGALRMKNDPVYSYRDALAHGYDRFSESL